jgi:hypothetical protein
MNGIRSKALLLGCLAALAGCHDYASYNDVVDPCYPQRYMCMAREEVNKPFGTQASNGLALDQTVWNYHFVEGTDKLNAMGIGHLDRLARRRPGPIPEIFVQTAQDVRYDPAKPEASLQARTELDQKRQKAVSDYLSAVRSDVPFKLAMHNPSPVGMAAAEADFATQGQLGAAVGTLNAATSATASAVRAGSQPTQNITTNVSK